MNKKLIKITITILSVFAFVLFILPVFKFSTDETTIVVIGLNLVEFSAWGGILLLIPLFILALLYSHMNVNQKTLGIIAIQCINVVGVHYSFYSAKQWAEKVSLHYVSPEPYLFIYTILVTMILILFYLYNEYFGNPAYTRQKFIMDRNK